MVKDKQNHLLKGAFILTIAGMLSKILSALYRIPLQNLTGDFGYYVYQQVYPFIGMLMMLSLYGFPAAVSKLTSEKKSMNQDLSFKNFMRPVLIILFVLSFILAGALYIFAPYLANLVKDEQLVGSYRLLSFGFLLTPLISFYRGYFQGLGDMRPTAYSQVFEQIFRVAIIIVIALLINQNLLGTYSISVGAVYATLIGGIISTIVLLIFKFKEIKTNQIYNKSSKVPWRYFINVLFMFGIIAALNHMILLLLQFADIFTLVPELINYGYSSKEAMEMKGVFDRGQPLIQFGAVLGSSFALSLIPEIARKKEVSKNETIQVIKDTLTISFYIAAGATVGLIFILPEVNLLLFENGIGTKSLQILMVSILLGSLAVTSNAVLQSYGYFKQITLFILSMFIMKYILNYYLVPKMGITGSALATIISLLLLSVLSMLFLRNKLTKASFLKMINWRAFLLALTSMGISLFILKYFLVDYFLVSRLILALYITVVVCIGAIIYFILLLRYDALSNRQLRTLPLENLVFKLEYIAKFKRG